MDVLLLHMVVNDDATQATPVDFPGMDSGEDFRFYFRRHWIHPARSAMYLIGWMIAFVALTYGSGVAAINDDFTRRIVWLLLYIFFLVPQITFLLKLYHHFLYVTVVTDKKIHQFKRTLVAVDQHETVDLWVLQDIHKSQRGIVQNMLGFGSLRLEAQNSSLTIHFVPSIDKTYGDIVRLREEARKRMLPGQMAEQTDIGINPT